MKKINKIREIPLKSKHIRWNCGKSEDNFDCNQNPFTRYYFAIVDNRFAYRKITQDKIFNMLSEQNSGVVQIGVDFELKVKNSECGLLFLTYDALANLEALKFSENGMIARRDYNLSKKKVLSIEDYLRTIYE